MNERTHERANERTHERANTRTHERANTRTSERVCDGGRRMPPERTSERANERTQDVPPPPSERANKGANKKARITMATTTPPTRSLAHSLTPPCTQPPYRAQPTRYWDIPTQCSSRKWVYGNCWMLGWV